MHILIHIPLEFIIKSSRNISPNRLLIATAAHNGYIQAENNEEDGEFQMAMTLTHNVNNQQLFFDVSLNEQVLSGNQACQQELHF